MRIGLEVHAALPTKTKLFCSCGTIAEEPNSSICPICMGLPGSKPMLNREALRIAKIISLGLNSKISDITSFIRKIYFYPDLPKSFQITQLERAIGIGGYVELSDKRIKIRRIQIEEDPAKIIRGDTYTLLDFNRSGIPLVEIVTEPDITSEDELREFLVELRSILYYSGVHIEDEVKVDLNISMDVERVEVKNITGINSIIAAARYEAQRQTELMKKGISIRTETRSYEESSMKTVESREKETEEEYGFIYEPDLTDFNTSDVDVAKPMLAGGIAHSLAKQYDLNEKTLRELVLFDRDALRLLEIGVKVNPNVCVGVIELMKKLGKVNLTEEVFDKIIRAASDGMQLNVDTINKFERNEDFEAADPSVDQKMIDDEITTLIKERSDLISEYKKNKKVFNFVVGAIIKEYDVSPKYVAERLALILEKMGV